MTLGALLLLLIGVGAMVYVLARTRHLARRVQEGDPTLPGELPEVELPADVAALRDAGEDDAAAHLLARRLGVPLGDARAILHAAD